MWSAASDRIAVVINRYPRLSGDLNVVDVRTGIVTTLAPLPGRGSLRILGFSPEGDRLLVSQDAQGELALWSVDTDGTDARLLVAGASVGGWLTSPVEAEPPATP